VRRAEPQWGTVISVDVRDPIAADVIEDLFDWFAQVDDLFSTWRADTEISRLGRGELDVSATAPEVRSVLAACADLRRETSGAFDIEVGRKLETLQPGQAPIDPSGYVKGWAVEEGARRLMTAGAHNFSIGAGGDVVVRGGPDSGDAASAWRIGIRHPWEGERVAMVLGLRDFACATSGRYERGDHVLDPRDGRPATELMSATVIGADLGIADAYATALMVLGADGLSLLANKPGYGAAVITSDRRVVVTPELERSRLS
jgi:thiamine biosynthesis lipoprotein